MGIVVIGAVLVDIKGYPLAQYIAGGRNSGRVLTVYGGVSRNVVEDIANVELRPTYIGIVDETATGADIIAQLERHKVNTSYMRQVKNGMGTWLAIFDNDGDVVASISQRPDLSEIGHILDDHGDEIFRDADAIAMEIDMDSAILKKVFQLAEKYQKKVYAVVSNMAIAMERRDLLQKTACIVCNREEAGLLFSDGSDALSTEELQKLPIRKTRAAQYPKLVVTLGAEGSVWADENGESGYCLPKNVAVIDTTGAGDAFFSGVVIGLTYGKSLGDACEIGTRLAASVIATKENVSPRFQPAEFELDVFVQ